MPEGDIGGGPPEHVVEDIRALSQALDQSLIPPKSLDRNLLIGTWNIRHFGGITERCLSYTHVEAPVRALGEAYVIPCRSPVPRDPALSGRGSSPSHRQRGR